MPLTKEIAQKYINRLLFSRLRILQKHGFYGLLLMHTKYGLDEECDTAYTDGDKICFSPKFMDDLSDSELDFIMMHEIMHIVLKHCYRDNSRDPIQFNIACDIVVNSNILYSNNLDINSITTKEYGESMHLTPDGREGYNFTAEEVYDMLLVPTKTKYGKDGKKVKPNNNSNKGKPGSGDFDNHDNWNKKKGEDKEQEDLWNQRLVDAVKSVEEREAMNGTGKIPLLAKRIVGELLNPQIDWRVVLNDFVQEEVCDYSFNPPDKRFGDSDFYLPDYNDTDTVVKDILFMVDTSGSIRDEDITKAYSEIKGAIDQFDGKLSGKLGFFDCTVYEPLPFESVDNLLKIKPKGGGGTSFHVIFNYINKYMTDTPPASIIILTDGYAEFPHESSANNIPVMWLINNDKVTPPWGRIGRLK